MKSPEEFQTFYEKTLRPHCEDLARELENIRNSALIVFGVLAAIAAVLALCIMKQPFFLPASAVAGLVAIGVPLVVYFTRKSSLNVDFKLKIVKQIVSFMEPGLDYQPGRYIPEWVFGKSQIFTHSIDRYSGEDMVTGKIGGVELSFSEVHAEYKTTTRDSKGHTQTQWHTIFKGVFFVADFNKNFNSTTVVVPDAAESAFGALLGNFLQKMNLSRSGQLIKLEDPEFEKCFAVYGHDQIEARYILSPAMMARIMKLRERLGSNIALSFADSKLNLAISTERNLFEMNSACLESSEGLMRICLDLCSLVEIIEDLNLQTRIWSKE